MLAGPHVGAVGTRGGVSQITVAGAFVFETVPLMATLRERRVAIGIATSFIRALWDAAEIYPAARSPLLALTDDQGQLLAQFGK